MARKARGETDARIFSGEEEANSIVSWLNFATGPGYVDVWRNKPIHASIKDKKYQEQRARIVEVLRLIRRARELAETATPSDYPNIPYHSPPFLQLEAIKKVRGQLYELLARYTYQPDIAPGPGGTLLSVPPWQPVGGGKVGDPYDDKEVVLDIVSLGMRGRLSVLRECQCGKWFFGKKSDQFSCSGACRKQRSRLKRTEQRDMAKYQKDLRELRRTHPNLK